MRLKILVIVVLFLLAVPVIAELQPGKLWINGVEIPYEKPGVALGKAAAVGCESITEPGNILESRTNADGTCTTVFQPDGEHGKDTYVNSRPLTDNANINFGNSDSFLIRDYKKEWSSDWAYPLLKFDFSKISTPIDKVISAKLSLYIFSGCNEGIKTKNANVYGINKDWDELKITFNNIGNYYSGNSFSSLTESDKNKWYIWNFNSDGISKIEEYLKDKNKNYGFTIKPDNEVKCILTYSSDSSLTDKRPKFEINYQLKECKENEYEKYYAEWKQEHGNCFAPDEDCSGTTIDNEFDYACCDVQDKCVFDGKCYPTTILIDVSSKLNSDYDASNDKEECVSYKDGENLIAAWIDADVGDQNRDGLKYCEQEWTKQKGNYVDAKWVNSGAKCQLYDRWPNHLIDNDELDYCDDTANGYDLKRGGTEGITTNYCCGDDSNEYYIEYYGREACCSSLEMGIDKNGNCVDIEDVDKNKCLEKGYNWIEDEDKFESGQQKCCGNNDNEYYTKYGERIACCSKSGLVIDEEGNCLTQQELDEKEDYKLLKEAVENEDKNKCEEIKSIIIQNLCYDVYAAEWVKIDAEQLALSKIAASDPIERVNNYQDVCDNIDKNILVQSCKNRVAKFAGYGNCELNSYVDNDCTCKDSICEKGHYCCENGGCTIAGCFTGSRKEEYTDDYKKSWYTANFNKNPADENGVGKCGGGNVKDSDSNANSCIWYDAVKAQYEGCINRFYGGVTYGFIAYTTDSMDECVNFTFVRDYFWDCKERSLKTDIAEKKKIELNCDTPVSRNYVCIEDANPEYTCKDLAGNDRILGCGWTTDIPKGRCADPDESKEACQKGIDNGQQWHWTTAGMCCGDDLGEEGRFTETNGHSNCCFEGEKVDEYNNCVK